MLTVMATSLPDDVHPGTEPANGDLRLPEVAAEIRGTLALVYRRIRQTKQIGDLTLPESSALGRLQRGGPMTAAALAKVELISPQSIGVTVASLEAKGLIERRADPADGRRVILTLTGAGDATVQARRSARDQQFTRALSSLSPVERVQLLEAMPLLERLAEEF
jgi:DNA-binding MarR family transcriptional regulator